MSSPAIKFRPSLTAAQLEYIVELLQSQDTKMSRECLQALQKFHLKAKHGIVSPSHVSLGKASIEQSLGFAEPGNDSTEFLLQVYQNSPHILTASQLARVQLHRYTNDLMSPEEEAAYESGAPNHG